MVDIIVEIQKGKHSCSLADRLKLWWYTKVKDYYVSNFSIMGYREELGEDQHDWNKLVGIGRSFPKWYISKLIPGHHWSSFRVGWRWYKGELQYSFYEYREGKRAVKIAEKDLVLAILEEIPPINLFPYHGGNRPATKDIYIYFELNKKE